MEWELLMSTRQSATSAKVILDSFLLYFPAALRCASMAETKAERTALSGEPPGSRKEELW